MNLFERLRILGRQVRGWLPEEPVASGPQEAKRMSDTNTLVMGVLVPLILVLTAWVTLAFVYGGLFVSAITYLLYIGLVLILLLHRSRSIKTTSRGWKT
jgi:hypothetical protein